MGGREGSPTLAATLMSRSLDPGHARQGGILHLHREE